MCSLGLTDSFDVPRAQALVLRENQIGDAGVTALAEACAGGAMASLTEVAVGTKHERHPQLVAACKKRGIEIIA